MPCLKRGRLGIAAELREWAGSASAAEIAAGSALVAAIALGVLLRLVWPEDIEYKLDEAWTFEHVRALAAGARWPWVGMPTSVGLPNPGLSLWIFSFLGFVSGARTAPELARAVQVMNIAAIFAFVAFAWVVVPRQRREPWLWAAALWAVSPLAVIFERKIWPPSVLPLMTVALMAAWWHRRRRAAAFVWGLLGAVMAQIHLGAGFLSIAVLVWTLISDRKVERWMWWLWGSVLGALPALPWLLQLSGGHGPGKGWRWPIATFFSRWVMQPFGLGVDYVLGRKQILEFLQGPWIGGQPTCLLAVVHILLAALLAAALGRSLWRMRTSGRFSARGFFIGGESSAVMINASLWGYGGLLTALTVAGAGSHRHYLIVLAPILHLWAATLVLSAGERLRGQGRALLLALCLLQAVVSVELIRYIHATQIIDGDYGPTWRAQQICGAGGLEEHSKCLRSLLGRT